MRSPTEKIMALEAAAIWRESLAKAGQELVVTNGCFDLLHRGHIEYLNQARSEGNALLVALNSDASIKALKGPERPMIGERDRAYLLASLEAVDAVVIFSEPQATTVFSRVPPDVYVKGGDYTEDTLDPIEYAELKNSGCRFCFIPFVDGYSTSQIIARIRGEATASDR